jgi:hypothetical protein
VRTTKTYLHLARLVFRDVAERLEARLLGQNVLPALASLRAPSVTESA